MFKGKHSISYDPLVNKDGSPNTAEFDEIYDVASKRRPRWGWIAKTLLAVGSLAAIMVYSCLLILGTWKYVHTGQMSGRRWLDSPMSSYIRYEPRVIDQDEYYHPFKLFGKPGPEIDSNWHTFFEHQNLRLSPEYMESVGRREEGIELPGGGYMGSLMVFHHMHCLKNLYHGLHPQYYGLDDFTPLEQADWDNHLDHCLYMLKEGVMCQADPTILTMYWSDDRNLPNGNMTSAHECVNWDNLMEWIKPNSFNAFEDGMLVHPTLGPPFIHGKPVHPMHGHGSTPVGPA